MIEIFGHSENFLVNNGGEFDIDEFRGFYKNLNIRIKTTAVESSWSNGLIEWHDPVIAEAVRKTKDYILDP